MNYDFPEITNLQQILDAIKDKKEFAVNQKADYTVIDYHVNLKDTFPSITTSLSNADREKAKLVRECRGIIFNSKTGEILRRPYHKFFNEGEKHETRISKIDITAPHVVLEKLDGSLIAPFMTEGDLRWGTKAGVTDFTDQVENFLRDKSEIVNWAFHLVGMGYTPLFEWCSRQNRIVIDHPVDRLVLTGIRNMKTGKYQSIEKLNEFRNITEIVKAKGSIGEDIGFQKFVDDVKDMKGEEGYVYRADSGHMVKVKASEYLLLHKTKEALAHEKNVWAVIVEGAADDLKSIMQPEDLERFTNFENDLNVEILKCRDELRDLYKEASDDVDNRDYSMFDDEAAEKAKSKAFAVEYANNQEPNLANLMFQVRKGTQPLVAVKKLILDATSTGSKLDGIRTMIPLYWDHYK